MNKIASRILSFLYIDFSTYTNSIHLQNENTKNKGSNRQATAAAAATNLTTTTRTPADGLTVTAHVQTVATTPARPPGSSDGLGVAVALAQSTAALAGRGQTTQFTVLVHGPGDPVDFGIPADGIVGGVDHDDLEVLVGGILGNPVGVQHTETSDATANTFLSNGLQATVRLQLVDTMALGLTVGATLGDWALTATTAHADAEDREALLGLVAQATSLVRAGWPWGTVELGQLAVLPDADTQQIAHDIALLLTVQFLHVSIGSHLELNE